MKPTFVKDVAELKSVNSSNHAHLKNEDSIEMSITDLVGHNKIERYFGDNLIDYTFIDGKGLGKDTVFRWHIPKSLFPNDKQFKIKIVPVPDNERLFDLNL